MKTVTVYLYAPGSRNDAIRTYLGVPYSSVGKRYESIQFKTSDGLIVSTSLEYIVQEDAVVPPAV